MARSRKNILLLFVFVIFIFTYLKIAIQDNAACKNCKSRLMLQDAEEDDLLKEAVVYSNPRLLPTFEEILNDCEDEDEDDCIYRHDPALLDKETFPELRSTKQETPHFDDTSEAIFSEFADELRSYWRANATNNGKEGKLASLDTDDIMGMCDKVLGIPKIALMFLTKGNMFHTETWNLWFESARDLLPVEQVHKVCNDTELFEMATHYCRSTNYKNVVKNQYLFNVYLHVGLNNVFKGFPEDSPWYQNDIKKRVRVKWGHFSLVTATKNLISVAFQNLHNSKFVLLSESDVPLYPPATLYFQLLHEEKSRINSCLTKEWNVNLHRMDPRMERNGLMRHHWRKSSQWFGVSRKIALEILKDTKVASVFRDFCPPSDAVGWHECFSDEHYFATLLAINNLDNETDCKGFIVNVDWTAKREHPRSYEAHDVTAARMRLLRLPSENCGYPSAIRTSYLQYVRANDLRNSVCNVVVPRYSYSLGPQCPLIARKFSPDSAKAVSTLLENCNSKLKIIWNNDCPDETLSVP